MPLADPLKDLLDLVRTAARDGVVEGLQTQPPAGAKPMAPLLDKRALAHALGVSTATVDRLCRLQRIPVVPVGEVRRFDLEAVRAALTARREEAAAVARNSPDLARGSPLLGGVRLLSRGKRGA